MHGRPFNYNSSRIRRSPSHATRKGETDAMGASTSRDYHEREIKESNDEEKVEEQEKAKTLARLSNVVHALLVKPSALSARRAWPLQSPVCGRL